MSDGQTVTLTASLSCSDQNAGYSGVHVRVEGGNIISYSSSHFSGHPFDANANPISLPAPIVEFDRTGMTTGTTYTASLTIRPTALGSMNIYYRGWASDLNDEVHCNYDLSKINPWQTLVHTTSVHDDSSSSPISMPRVELWT